MRALIKYKCVIELTRIFPACVNYLAQINPVCVCVCLPRCVILFGGHVSDGLENINYITFRNGARPPPLANCWAKYVYMQLQMK